jgi:hypothetical protein
MCAKQIDGQAKVQTLDDVENSDLKAARNEYLWTLPFLADTLKSKLRDERDLPLVWLQLNIVTMLLPAAVLIFWVNMNVESSLICFLCGVAYFVLLVIFEERFILMLHFSSHRAIYKNPILHDLMVWALPPFFGIPPGTVYHSHHVIMHHIENNHGMDISSTEMYQRDNLLHFLMYWIRFAVFIAVEVPAYSAKTKRWFYFWQSLAGIAFWACTIYFLKTQVSPGGTFWVFVFPHIFSMTAMAFGNWSQHIFVDPDRPMSNYTLTYNCMDTPGNQTTFNDGYHIVHHLNARLHWTEMPKYFHDTREKHFQGGAITFRGTHFFDVGIMVMTGQLHKLAQHYVHLGKKEEAPTLDEVVEIFKKRLLPVDPALTAKKVE